MAASVQNSVLVFAPETATRSPLVNALAGRGMDSVESTDAADALLRLAASRFHVAVLADPRSTPQGLSFLEAARRASPQTQIVVMADTPFSRAEIEALEPLDVAATMHRPIRTDLAAALVHAILDQRLSNTFKKCTKCGHRQGNDIGTQYRSAIFATSDEQQTIARRIMQEVDRAGKWKAPIVTEIVTAGTFTSAEEEHQKYLLNNPGGYSCHYVRD